MLLSRAKILIQSFIVVLLLLAGAVVAQSPAPSNEDITAQVVNHLIDYVSKSGFRFIRNGVEHDSMSAAKHLREKYNFLKGSINTTDEFIEKAATRSALTGSHYLVKMPDGTTQPLSEWLGKESGSFLLKRSPDTIEQASERDRRISCATDEDCVATKEGGCIMKVFGKEFANIIDSGGANKDLCKCLKGPVRFGCVPRGSEWDRQ